MRQLLRNLSRRRLPPLTRQYFKLTLRLSLILLFFSGKDGNLKPGNDQISQQIGSYWEVMYFIGCGKVSSKYQGCVLSPGGFLINIELIIFDKATADEAPNDSEHLVVSRLSVRLLKFLHYGLKLQFVYITQNQCDVRIRLRNLNLRCYSSAARPQIP